MAVCARFRVCCREVGVGGGGCKAVSALKP